MSRSAPPLRSNVLAGIVVFLLAGCTQGGGGAEPPAADRAASPGSTPTATWATPPPPTETGALEVDAFNEFVREKKPEWASSPLRSAIEYLSLPDPLGETTTIRVTYPSVEGGSPAVVTITKDRLPDDSIRTSRAIMTFRQSGPRWRLVSAQVSRRCWPGRGHQDFSPELCV